MVFASIKRKHRRGALSEPKIDVNGWSALAPGFIRNLFEGENTAPLEERKSNRTSK